MVAGLIIFTRTYNEKLATDDGPSLNPSFFKRAVQQAVNSESVLHA